MSFKHFFLYFLGSNIRLWTLGVLLAVILLSFSSVIPLPEESGVLLRGFITVVVGILGFLLSIQILRYKQVAGFSVDTVLFLPVLLAALLSAAISQTWIDSLIGTNADFGTIFSYLLLFVILYIASRIAVRGISLFLIAALGAGTVGIITTFIATISGNLVINLQQVSLDTVLVFAFSAFIAFSILELLPDLSVRPRVVIAAVGYGALIVLAFIAPIFIAVLIILLLLLLLWVSMRGRSSVGSGQALFTVIIFVILLLASTFFNIPRISLLAGDAPPLTESFHIVQIEYKETLNQLLFGTGPNTFEQTWDQYRSVKINKTPFWNAVVISSGSALIDRGATVGVVGLFTWFLFSVVTIFRWLYIIFTSKTHSGYLYVLYFASGAISTLGLFVIFFAGVHLGTAIVVFASIGFLSAIPVERIKRNQYILRVRKRRFVLSVLVFSLAIAVIAVGVWYTYAALVYRDVITMDDQSSQQQKSFYTKIPHDDIARNIALIELQRLVSITEDKILSQEQKQSLFVEQSQRAIAAASRATSLNPHDMKNWLSLGSVYAQLAVFGVVDSDKKARTAYEKAAELAPSHPVPHILLGKLELALGNVENAENALRDTLSLKPDYEEARVLLEQLLDS